MFIGHFAIAYIYIALFPSVHPLIPLAGVCFPDLLWPILIFLGWEEVQMDPDNPLQYSIRFIRYPFSHSLILGTLIALMFGLVIMFFTSPLAGLVFVSASASHWLLDSTTHVGDLPVVGIGRDRKVGFGLWARPRAAFLIELVFYVVVTLVAARPGIIVPLLALGFAFHLLNANSFLGSSKGNPFNTPGKYATVVLAALLAFIFIANWIITG